MTELYVLVGVIFLLVGLIAMQQVFFLSQIHKLVDKVMSRSYTEYVRAETNPRKEDRIFIPNEAPEDLRTLQEFSL